MDPTVRRGFRPLVRSVVNDIPDLVLLMNESASVSRIGRSISRLVSEIDDPLSGGAVVEALKVLADGRPRTALFVGR